MNGYEPGKRAGLGANRTFGHGWARMGTDGHEPGQTGRRPGQTGVYWGESDIPGKPDMARRGAVRHANKIV